MPLLLVVKLGRKMRSLSASAMPLPLSRTSAMTCSSVRRSTTVMFGTRPSGMDCSAFFSRLLNTRSNCSRSARMGRVSPGVRSSVKCLSNAPIRASAASTTSARSRSSSWVRGICAKLLNSPAMLLSASICSTMALLKRSKRSAASGASGLQVR